jgi:hypothetical protein
MPTRSRTAIRNCMLSTALIALLSVAVGCSCQNRRTQATGNPQVIDVCEALSNFQSYRGRMVTIRGVYFNGLQGKCERAFITGIRTWPSAIEIVVSSFVSGTADAVPFETDLETWFAVEALVLREAKAGRREEIWASITGMYQAPSSYLRPDGLLFGGYGHLGMYPAQLVVQRVSDVQIKQIPTFDYKLLLRPKL